MDSHLFSSQDRRSNKANFPVITFAAFFGGVKIAKVWDRSELFSNLDVNEVAEKRENIWKKKIKGIKTDLFCNWIDEADVEVDLWADPWKKQKIFFKKFLVGDDVFWFYETKLALFYNDSCRGCQKIFSKLLFWGLPYKLSITFLGVWPGKKVLITSTREENNVGLCLNYRRKRSLFGED